MKMIYRRWAIRWCGPDSKLHEKVYSSRIFMTNELFFCFYVILGSDRETNETIICYYGNYEKHGGERDEETKTWKNGSLYQ